MYKLNTIGSMLSRFRRCVVHWIMQHRIKVSPTHSLPPQPPAKRPHKAVPHGEIPLPVSTPSRQQPDAGCDEGRFSGHGHLGKAISFIYRDECRLFRLRDARAGLKEEMNFRSVEDQMGVSGALSPHSGYLILQLGGWGIWNRAGGKGVLGHPMGRALDRGLSSDLC